MDNDGFVLSRLYWAGAERLVQERDHLNKINTFPVPDGDSGTNMAYTMTAAAEAAATPDRMVGHVAQRAARAALLSARGNSGIILSQILAGLGQTLKDLEIFTTADLASAFARSSELAYRAVAQPVEGTILTVIRCVAETAQDLRHAHLPEFLSGITNSARAAVADGPRLFPKLAQDGVVDAGGLGLAVILSAMHDALGRVDATHLGGLQAVRLGVQVAQGGTVHAPSPAADARYGYEVQYVQRGSGLDLSAMRSALQEMGDSLLVVGDDTTVKVHIHTTAPQRVVDWALAQGDLDDLTFEDLDAQAGEFRSNG